MSRVIALERYVGKPVRDAAGRNLGHLHDVRVREEGGELVVIDYLVGRAGLVEREGSAYTIPDIQALGARLGTAWMETEALVPLVDESSRAADHRSARV